MTESLLIILGLIIFLGALKRRSNEKREQKALERVFEEKEMQR